MLLKQRDRRYPFSLVAAFKLSVGMFTAVTLPSLEIASAAVTEPTKKNIKPAMESLTSKDNHVSPPSETTVAVQYDLGFLGVQNHRLMLSRNNTYFDYLEDGAQDNLFKYERYTLKVSFPSGDQLKLLYQPLNLETQVTLQDDLLVENVLFPKATPMTLTYDFPYYRATYLWNLVNSRTFKIGLGGGLQARNATINFADLAGSQLVTVRDVGPVPLFSAAVEADLGSGYRLHFDVEGNYANTSYLNGDDDDGVRGAILDTALAVSFQPSQAFQVISSLRYIGGGAEGQSDEADTTSGDGYASNWIDLAAFSAGVSYQLLD